MINALPPVDDVFAALAAPTRRALVEHLGRGSASVSELAEPLDISLAAVVQHVQVLTACGLVESEKRGRTRRCRLRPDALELARDWIAARQEAFWQAALSELELALDDEDAAGEEEA